MRSAPSTWRSRPSTGPYSPSPREPIPRIVAEALVAVADPLCTRLDPACGAAPADLVRDLCASLAPAEAAIAPPAWLRPDQVAPFRRVVAALDRYSGVLLADPVGSGKTYVALAAALARSGREAAVALVPASLGDQWRATAARLDVPLVVHSHERLSRGHLPRSRTRLAIVDESHRFRNAGIRRYRELAEWLVGRQVLLLSATPIVNRLEDLTHQLLLGVRDDALALAGVPSLRQQLAGGGGHGALGHLVLCRAAPVDRPAASQRVIAADPIVGGDALLAAIDGLALSRDRGIAALIRMVLWRALGSSPQALSRALERYLALLDHARLAGEAGRVVTRAAIRSFTDGALDQLILWELMPPGNAPADLVPADRSALEQLLATARNVRDPRVDRLRAVLSDQRPSLVFTRSRDTLEALRQVDLGRAVAWVTGTGSGIGTARLPREAVLAWFRPGAGPRDPHLGAAGPAVLLATDVAAEGLDLQLAGRIVHYDLPWTSTRIDQREGRVVRLGGAGAAVDVVQFAPWPALEHRVHQSERLLLKRQLANTAGLDDGGRWLFRWRSELAGTPGDLLVPPVVGDAGSAPGWLVGLALDLVAPDGGVLRQPADLLWLADDGSVEDDPRITVPLLMRAARLAAGPFPDATEQQALQARLAPLVRARLQAGLADQWQSRETAPERRRLAAALRRLALRAAERRDRPMVELTDRGLDWLGGGLTAGESAIVARLVSATPDELADSLPRLVARPRRRLLPMPRLTGALRLPSPHD